MSDIDEVKNRIDIAEYIGSRIKLSKAGRNFRAVCPFHNEKTPSFMVSPERQRFHCFGCGKDGSVFDFVMEYEHVEFREALEILAERAGVKLTPRSPETPEDRLRQTLLELHHLASEYYRYMLTEHSFGEKARLYLKERGVSDRTRDAFGIGYSPNSWDGLCRYLEKKGYDRHVLRESGLVVVSESSRVYDRFRGRLMFPLRDHRGQTVGFSGRVLVKDTKDAKYINSPETSIYHKRKTVFGLDLTKSNITEKNQAILVEGEFGVISLYQAGISHVVAVKGSSLTEDHVRLLRRYCDRMILMFDGDKAGDAATRRGISIAETVGFDLSVVLLPAGKDPDDIIREKPGDLKQLLKSPLPVYDYYLASVTGRYDRTTPYGKKRIAEEYIPILSEINNPVIANFYTKRLAESLGVGEEAIREGILSYRHKSSIGRRRDDTAGDKPDERRSPEEQLELSMLAMIVQSEARERFDAFREEINLDDLSSSGIRRILTFLEKHLKDTSTFLLRDFADQLPRELVSLFDEAALMDLSTVLSDSEKLASTWEKSVKRLQRLIVSRKIADITSRLKEIQEQGLSDEEAALQERQSAYIVQLARLEKAG